MEIVIEISKEDYDSIKYNTNKTGSDYLILNGRILPKVHGRLIILSEDAVKREQVSLSFSCQNWISEVGLSNATVRIIEADGGVG